MADILAAELKRQQDTLMLIPSENYASRAVMAAAGSVFTNKYAEGYPGNRYYNGCEFYDQMERLAIDRARKLFGADHANVQPHTGSQANMAAYHALIKPGDRLLAMSVAQGGHLTHGAPVNFSGQLYQPHFYSVSRESGWLDYDEIAEIARQVRPRVIVAGASAYPRIIDFQRFREIADEVGAYIVSDIAHIAGLVAAGCHPDPVPFSDVVTTTTHKTLRGPRGALILSKADYAAALDRAVFPGVQAGPLMHIIAAKAVALHEAGQVGFHEYQRQIIRNSQVLAQSLLEEGFDLVTGGTDNHLMLVDLRNKAVNGRQAADLCEQANMVVNFNLIPWDPCPPREASGIRPGTPGITTRGMKEEEAALVGKLLARVINDAPTSPAVLDEVRAQVLDLCHAFPIYADLEI
jgi:glycine hydroxymethyltransferase